MMYTYTIVLCVYMLLFCECVYMFLKGKSRVWLQRRLESKEDGFPLGHILQLRSWLSPRKLSKRGPFFLFPPGHDASDITESAAPCLVWTRSRGLDCQRGHEDLLQSKELHRRLASCSRIPLNIGFRNITHISNEALACRTAGVITARRPWWQTADGRPLA